MRAAVPRAIGARGRGTLAAPDHAGSVAGGAVGARDKTAVVAGDGWEGRARATA